MLSVLTRPSAFLLILETVPKLPLPMVETISYMSTVDTGDFSCGGAELPTASEEFA